MAQGWGRVKALRQKFLTKRLVQLSNNVRVFLVQSRLSTQLEAPSESTGYRVRRRRSWIPNGIPRGSTVLSHSWGDRYIRDIIVRKNAVDEGGEERDEGLFFIHITREWDSCIGMLPK
jgi:hypothetical protein